MATIVFAYKPETKPDNQWSAKKSPTPGYPQAIGSYANGCMSGAKALPAAGEGFVDMRRNRNRFYGQPELIDFIKKLGTFTEKHHERKHLIGDLSQPRGGRMNFGHSSHQMGLDVDIWMQTLPIKQTVNPLRDMQTVVNKLAGTINGGHLPAATRDALYFSATHPAVARIFVNPVIKAYLCQNESDTRWLNKIRPWWGHDQHFHVRLSCQENHFQCKNQQPPPPGDGCNSDLYDWVAKQADAIINPPKPQVRTTKKKPKVLPQACQFILNQQ